MLKVRSPILDMLCMIFAQAQTGSPGPMPGGGIGSFFVPLIFIFIIMYFVMIQTAEKAAGTATEIDRKLENR